MKKMTKIATALTLSCIVIGAAGCAQEPTVAELENSAIANDSADEATGTVPQELNGAGQTCAGQCNTYESAATGCTDFRVVTSLLIVAPTW